MLLSIVTGTHQRLPYLQKMVESVRANMPLGVQYEILVVDAFSLDGTEEWCKAQPDMDYMRHGEFRGAIKSFCDGARRATGDFVILANDDISFHPYSIMKAVRHLETHHNCGMVAFSDNRSMQIYGVDKHRVERIAAIGLDNQMTTVPYGQVALCRTWIGNELGWWGDQDLVMKDAKTYGGDSYLSARIWSMGYTVDAVDGCAIDDGLARDGLRDRNAQTGEADSRLYYARFPSGPRLKEYPTMPNHQRERLRVVLMDMHEAALPARTMKHKGLVHGLSKHGLVWHIDYGNEEYDLPRIIDTWQPHILITQMHAPGKINARALAEARSHCPSMMIVNWNGDAHLSGLTTPEVLEALQHVDLQTTINAKALPVYEAAGINAAYWQIGAVETDPYPNRVHAHDILLQMNCYSDSRRMLVEVVNLSGYEVGLYGSCEGAIESTHYQFDKQSALYAAATITIGDTFPDTEGYCSNRVLQALHSGAFLLQQHSFNLDKYTGLQAGVHFAEWSDLDDLRNKINYWMRPERLDDRKKITQAGRDFVTENFSVEAQVKKLWSLL